MDFLIPFIFLACVVLAVSFILWSLGSIQSSQEKTRKVEAKQVTARNTLNQFMSKLATVDETFEALDILVSSFWEEINCESIGIYVLDQSSDSGKKHLKGAACTAMFPIFDEREEKAYSSTWTIIRWKTRFSRIRTIERPISKAKRSSAAKAFSVECLNHVNR